MTDAESAWWLTPGPESLPAESSSAESSSAESSSAESSLAESSSAESSPVEVAAASAPQRSAPTGTSEQEPEALASYWAAYVGPNTSLRHGQGSNIPIRVVRSKTDNLAFPQSSIVPEEVVSSIASKATQNSFDAPPVRPLGTPLPRPTVESVLQNASPYASPVYPVAPYEPPNMPWLDDDNPEKRFFCVSSDRPTLSPERGAMISWVKFPYQIPEDDTIYEVVATISHVSAHEHNHPREELCATAVISWDRAGRNVASFADQDLKIALSDVPDERLTRWVNLHDFANPDEYLHEGKLDTWRKDLAGLFGPFAIAAFISATTDALVVSPVFPLGPGIDTDSFLRIVDSHSDEADGLIVISPRTAFRHPQAHSIDYAYEITRDVSRLSAWYNNQLLEIEMASSIQPYRIHVGTQYGNDAESVRLAHTNAHLAAARYAKDHQVKQANKLLARAESLGR